MKREPKLDPHYLMWRDIANLLVPQLDPKEDDFIRVRFLAWGPVIREDAYLSVQTGMVGDTYIILVYESIDPVVTPLLLAGGLRFIVTTPDQARWEKLAAWLKDLLAV